MTIGVDSYECLNYGKHVESILYDGIANYRRVS